MKKLKLDFQHLGSAEVLTRSQLKQIMGGDGGSGDGCKPSGWSNGSNCCWHGAGWGSYDCEVTMEQAKDLATYGGNWCCSSCGTSYSGANNC